MPGKGFQVVKGAGEISGSALVKAATNVDFPEFVGPSRMTVPSAFFFKVVSGLVRCVLLFRLRLVLQL